MLLDVNFDADGLLVAEADGRIVGAAYGVRRLTARVGSDLETGTGWLVFFFVAPQARGAGLGWRLVRGVLDWLATQGVTTVHYSGYTPNYFLPGLDETRYRQAAGLLRSQGFVVDEYAHAMDQDLTDYEIPDRVRSRVAELESGGWRFGSPHGDDVVELVDVAGRFSWDWAQGLRESAIARPESVVMARSPQGGLIGWAAVATWDGDVEHFGPFGVLPSSRGTGLGECLLHLTLERVRALGGHNAWFLWVEQDTPAYSLYRKAGFRDTRTLSILHADLPSAVPPPKPEHPEEFAPKKGNPS